MQRYLEPSGHWHVSASDSRSASNRWHVDRTMTDARPALVVPDSSLGTDALWWNGFSPAGAVGPPGRSIDADVSALAVYRGELVVGGDFAFMDGVETRGLASWDGESWHPLGEGHAFWGANCFVVHHDRLVAGGSTWANGGSSSVYAWDGQEWEGIGSGQVTEPYSWVQDLVVLDDHLVAAGHFIRTGEERTFIVRWNGTAWEDIGPDSLYGGYPLLTDLAVYRDTLYAAGAFHLAADDSLGNLVRWRGDSWEVVGGGTDGTVYALEVYRDQLIVSGSFGRAGDAPVHNIAAWNGGAWAALGGGLQSDHYSFVGTLLASDDRLVVAGQFESAGDVAARDVAIWNGAMWDSLATLSAHPGAFQPIRCLTSFENRIIAGGIFDLGEGGYHADVIAWDTGMKWVPVSTRGTQLVGTPYAILATPEGLVCEGEFTLPGQLETTTAIARWDGTHWHVLGDRLDAPVSAFALYRSQIIAAGWFHTIDGDSLNYIASWDGGSWHPLGEGLSGPALALKVRGDHLIVGGAFAYAGGDPLLNIAQWDGHSWRPLGNGVWRAGLSGVTDLAIYDGELYVCGYFTWAGDTPARSIARWNGARWDAIDGELTFKDNDPWIGELEVWNGQLVAAGNFETAGGEESRKLAIWDGIHWRPLKPLLDMAVTELASDQGRLVVGGVFSGPQGFLDSNYILQWDGTRWLRMGSGLWSGRDGVWELPGVTAVAGWDGALYAGGHFRFAGDKPSFHIARWDGRAFGAPPPRPTLTVMPNPALDVVSFGWHLDGPGTVVLRVFNVLGREVARPVSGLQPGGPGAQRWALSDNLGKRVAAGVYFVHLESERGSTVSRVVVLR